MTHTKNKNGKQLKEKSQIQHVSSQQPTEDLRLEIVSFEVNIFALYSYFYFYYFSCVLPLPKHVTCLINLSYAPIFIMYLLQVSVNNSLNERT